MKKIVALLLVLVTLLFAVGCNNNSDEVDKVMAAYNNAMPTKIVVDTVTSFDGAKVLSKAELTTGSYQGKKASVYTHTYQKFESVDELLTSPIISKSESMEYFEGVGLRENFISNKYATFVNGDDFAPDKIDSIIPNLSMDVLTEVSYENGVFEAIIPKANAVAVFGEGITLPTDATIEIVIAGGTVISLTVVYSIPATVEGSPDGIVTMTVTYSYDVQLLSPLTNS